MSKKKGDGENSVAPGYEPGLVEKGSTKLPDFEGFTLMELRALEEYAQDLDMVRACAAAGYKNAHNASKQLQAKEKIRAEMQRIHEIWRNKMLETTADNAASWHLGMMKQFWNDYQELPKLTEKGQQSAAGQLAGTLARMSDSFLRSTGNFDEQGSGDGQVVINIDMGDGEVEVDDTGKKAKVKQDKE